MKFAGLPPTFTRAHICSKSNSSSIVGRGLAGWGALRRASSAQLNPGTLPPLSANERRISTLGSIYQPIKHHWANSCCMRIHQLNRAECDSIKWRARSFYLVRRVNPLQHEAFLAAMSAYVPEKSAATDIAALWYDALKSYSQTTGHDLSKVPRFTSVNDIMQDRQLQADVFNKKRHPGTKVDKLRSALSQSSDLIQTVGGYIASAAAPVWRICLLYDEKTRKELMVILGFSPQHSNFYGLQLRSQGALLTKLYIDRVSHSLRPRKMSRPTTIRSWSCSMR